MKTKIIFITLAFSAILLCSDSCHAKSDNYVNTSLKNLWRNNIDIENTNKLNMKNTSGWENRSKILLQLKKS